MTQCDHDLQCQREFAEFLAAPPLHPPEELGESLFSTVRFRLMPPGWWLFTKLFAVHALIGTVTLAFCDPFGVSLASSGINLMHLLMQWGETVCMSVCGALFLGFSFLVSSLVLTFEEIRAIRRTGVLQPSLIALASLALFVCHPEAFVTLNLALPWFFGAVIVGHIAFRLGSTIRLNRLSVVPI